MQQKTDFEIVKELNDLREGILVLKEERDKILRHLNENGLETKKHFNEVGSEALLSYIQKLTVDKTAMGEELRDREQSIGVLRQQLTVTENRLAVVSEQLAATKEEATRQAEESERLRRRADEKEREASRCLELLNRREAELAADLQERELIAKASQSERDRLVATLAELSRGINKADEEHGETIRLLTDTNRVLKERFVNAVAEIRAAEPRKHEELIEVLHKLIDRTNMMSQKEAKILVTEDKAKKLAAKTNSLKRELKNVKQLEEETLLKQILNAVQNPKATGKKGVTWNENAITKLLETATTSQPKTKSPDIDHLNAEVGLAQATIRKREAECNLLSERVAVLEVELEKAKEEARLADKEVKRLSKETKKTTKLFNEEIAELMSKMGNRQAQVQEDRSREIELAAQLREKKE